MLTDRTDRGLDELALLAEPVRRALYRYVLDRPEPVSRDEAAAALQIGRALAAFHLDRLVEGGLLETEYRRLSGRSGPGAGRPAKLYRRAPGELLATLPERRYEVAAELFAQALTSPSDGEEHDVGDVAARYGRSLGEEARRRAGPRAGVRRRLAAVESVLRDAGYAPFVRDGELRLLNCPFHGLAARHRDLTCGMNLSLLQGILAGARLPVDQARLDPQPGLCCVAIRDD